MFPDQPQPTIRTCGVCWREFTPSRANNIYCCTRCKNAAFDRKRRPPRAGTTRDTDQHPTTTSTRGPQPAAVRDCPHCGTPITIVALLTTPDIARPTLPATTPDTVIPLHRP